MESSTIQKSNFHCKQNQNEFSNRKRLNVDISGNAYFFVYFPDLIDDEYA